MNKPKVFVDFHNADEQGHLRLNCLGTIEDLAQRQIVLRDGVCLTLYSEELEVEGVVEYSTDEHLWVAVIDWRTIKDIGVPGHCSPRPSVTAGPHRLTLPCAELGAT